MNPKRNSYVEIVKKGTGIVAGITALASLSNCTTELELLSKDTQEEKDTIYVNLNKSENAGLSIEGASQFVAHPNNPDFPIIVHNKRDGEFIAFSSKCTHLGCPVPLPDEDGKITCPCHFAIFSNEGKVLSGPAKEDLLPYTAIQRDSLLLLTDGDL